MRLSKFTDHHLASMLDCLQDGRPCKKNELIAEVAYRLFRAGGGPLDARQGELLDIIATGYYRGRIEKRKQRRSGKQLAGGQSPLPPKKPPASVVDIGEYARN